MSRKIDSLSFLCPRNTAIFAPTFEGTGIVRSADITRDPRYGHNPPYHGMPEGHLPVRSYLAVPVTSRTGEVLGGLFFGHAKPGILISTNSWLQALRRRRRLLWITRGCFRNRSSQEKLLPALTRNCDGQTPIRAVLPYSASPRLEGAAANGGYLQPDGPEEVRSRAQRRGKGLSERGARCGRRGSTDSFRIC